MSKLSERIQVGNNYIWRAWFDAGGKGVVGATLTVKVTKPDGANLSPIVGLVVTERSNVSGDSEVAVDVANFALRGIYTVGVTTNDPATDELVAYVVRDYNPKRFTVVSGTLATSQFTTDLSASYGASGALKSQWFRFDDDTPTAALRGIARKIFDYIGSTGLIVVVSDLLLPAAPQAGVTPDRGELIP